jgi:hypothetical protein
MKNILLVIIILCNYCPILYSQPTIGSSGATYSTLKLAFDDINNGTLTGDVVLEIIENTTELSSAVLNASGSGSADYTSVTIYPASSGLSISGNLAEPLIDLNGADNVTFDGRVNQSGSDTDLSIVNESTSTDGGTCTIRFINDATNNNIQYCNIKGSTLSENDGIITISTADTDGNDHNTLEYNNITNFDDDRPINAFFSLGTSGAENDNLIISNNNIYDFLNPANDSYGISILDYNTACTVSYNSFYETTDFAPTAQNVYILIGIHNDGGEYDVSTNYIGGDSPLCNGTWVKTNSDNSLITGIAVWVDTDLDCSINNNLIKGFSVNNSDNGEFYGLWIGNSALTNNSTIEIKDNTIGSSTGTGSIVLNNDGPDGMFFGMLIGGAGTFDIDNNVIGAITLSNTDPQDDTSFLGICLVCDDAVSCTNNLIGSTETANSILASSTSASNAQIVFGISADFILGNIAETDFSGNTVANMTNNFRGVDIVVPWTPLCGIYSLDGDILMTNNTVRDLKIDSYFHNVLPLWTSVGIFIEDASNVREISGNSVYNISATNTFDLLVFMAGILTYGFDNTNTVPFYNNYVSNIYANSSDEYSFIMGIQNDENAVYYNNIVNLGQNVSSGFDIVGVYDTYSFDDNDDGCDFYFNTINICGTTSDITGFSYCFYNDESSDRDLRNNILNNSRVGGEKNYSIGIEDNSTLTFDYIDYYSDDILADYNGTDKSTLADWQAVTAGDANSITTMPIFYEPCGNNPEDFKLYVNIEGIAIGTVTEDYDGITRNDPPTIGAYKYVLDPPIVTTQSVSSINPVSATGNGNISNTHGVSCEERGVLYYNYTDTDEIRGAGGVSESNDNTGDFGIGPFTQSLSSLSQQTRYNARAYAKNGAGNGYGARVDFWTLSEGPTGQASDLQAIGTSSSQIDLSWTSAIYPSFGATVKGYVLVRSIFPDNPVFDSQDGEAPSAGLGTTLVSSSISGSSISYNDNTGLSSDTRYNYILIPYCWNGTNEETYNYLLTNAPTADGRTLKAEPTNHVTNFHIGVTTGNSVELLWSDVSAGVVPDGYLIRGSDVSYAAIASPADRNPISDNGLDINILSGAEQHTFTGLNEGTRYYFKIFPYTNSGIYIDYKLDGNVPEIYGNTKTMNVWFCESYCEICNNGGHIWGINAFNDLNEAISVLYDGGTLHIGCYSEIENIETTVLYDTDNSELKVTGNIPEGACIITSGIGHLLLEGSAPLLFPICTEGLPVYVEISNFTGTYEFGVNYSSDNRYNFKSVLGFVWDLIGPENLKATIKFKIPKSIISREKLNSQFLLSKTGINNEWIEHSFSLDEEMIDGVDYWVIIVNDVDRF